MTDARGARIVRLLEDPAVSGEVLLVGVALAAKYDFALDYGCKLSGMAKLLWPTSDMRIWRLKDALRRDIRTYKQPAPGNECLAPMLRRPGPCGRSTCTTAWLTDWTTGEVSALSGCTRHRDWVGQQQRRNWEAKPVNPPLPHANHGGALRVHFPRINWPEFWRRLDPRWVEHPEGTLWPKPTLSLVLGDGEDNEGYDRPLLTAVGHFGPRPEEAP